MRARIGALVLVGLVGCWKTDYAELPASGLTFSPSSAAPAGWVISTTEVPSVLCPDGRRSTIYTVHPEEPTESLRIAVLFHSGAFDYYEGSDPENPQLGRTYQNPSRLTREWAARQVFVTLGMYPVLNPGPELHEGALVAALAEQGVATILPANCWGDWWHNDFTSPNDAEADGFARRGRDAATFAFELATDPTADDTAGVDFPLTPGGAEVYLIGYSEGGRAVSELLLAGAEPTAVLLDSPIDDLRVYYTNFPAINQGLANIFPDGVDTVHTASMDSVLASTTVERVGLILSDLDPIIPSNANTGLLTQLNSSPEAWVNTVAGERHVITGADADVALEAVDWLLDLPE